MKTVQETATELLPVELWGAYDCALPQPFVDYVYRALGLEARGNIVWIYDKLGACFGRPYPLNMSGQLVIREYNLKEGTSYPSGFEAI